MFCKLLNKRNVFIGSIVLLLITACNMLNGQFNYDELSQEEQQAQDKLTALIREARASRNNMREMLKSSFCPWSPQGWRYCLNEMQRKINEIHRILTLHPKLIKTHQPILWSAVLCGVQAIVEVLVNAGADLDAQHETLGETALYAAVRLQAFDDINIIGFNYIGIIKFLVAKGAAIDIKNKKSLTPLALALTRNNLDIARHLINVYANVGSLESAFSNLPQDLVRTRRKELEKILDQAGLPRDVYNLLIEFVTEQ